MTHSAEHQDLKTQVHHLEAMANRKEPAKEIESKSASNEDITASTRTEAKSGINRHTILAFLAISGQLNAYELTLLIPSTTLSYINADLGPSPIYPWITITWSLGAAVLVSIGGRLSDIFGRRYFMLAGALIAFLGTIIGATGQSIEQMIVSGIFFGVGAGFQEMGYSCLAEIVPNEYRMMFIGLYCTSALPSVLAPIYAYAFIAHTNVGWRGAYWYMCAFQAVAGLFLFFFYKPPTFHTKHKNENTTKWRLLMEMDFVGLFMFIASCSLLLVGINFGGRQYPWKSATTIAPIAVGVLAFVALFIWEFKAPLKYPLLPPKLLKDFRGFNVLICIGFLSGMLYYSMQVIWPRQSGLLFVPPEDTIMRGVYANIPPLGNLVAVTMVWTICQHVHHERWQLVFFVVVQTALVGAMASVGINDKVKAIVLIFLISSFTNQPILILITMVSLNLKDQTDIGVGIGVMSTFRLLGGGVASAIYTATISSEFADKLPGEIAKAVQPLGFNMADTAALVKAAALSTTKAYAEVPGITPEIIQASDLAVKISYVGAYKVVFLVALAFGISGIICAFLSRSTPMSKKNSDKAVLLENENSSTDDLEGSAEVK